MTERAKTVYVLNFGAQYSKLIARRVREANVYSKIIDPDISSQKLAKLNPAGIILSGGPKSVNIEGAPHIDPEIYNLGVPILGICYGAQLMAKQLGGEVSRNETGEYGRTKIQIQNSSTLLPDASILDTLEVWMSHFDAITSLPQDFTLISSSTASSETAPIMGTQNIAGFENADKKLFGVQYHPEVVQTQQGKEIFGNFLSNVCKLEDSWRPESIVKSSVAEIKERVGDKLVICGLSGGVDSAVAATLVHQAIGDQLTCIFLDNGLMRQGEVEQIQEAFSKPEMPRLVTIDATDVFLSSLAGITDAEEKRKAVGKSFISVFEEAARNIGEYGAGHVDSDGDVAFLVQGTIYSDVIESGAGDSLADGITDGLANGPANGPSNTPSNTLTNASLIKSHHNVGGLPENMELDLIEPLRDLFKDEVRQVGESLGLPADIVWRQPFPGPGLSVRIIGEVTAEKVAILQKADAIIREETAVLGREIWQAFGVLLDIKSVGVMGDERTYSNPLVIRAVTSEDAMTADWVRLPHEMLEKISTRITNEVAGINRVAYDVTSKPPATIEWE